MFYTADGTQLPAYEWLPPGKPKALLVALHGFNDYSHSFADAGLFFSAHHIALFAYDQRGFGASSDPGIWGGQKNYVDDAKQYILQLSARYPHIPIYLLGESMGGAVVLTAAANPAFPKVKGIVVVAPAIWGGDTMNPLYRSVLWTVAHTMPAHEFTGSNLHILASNNIPMLRALGKDPLVQKKARGDAIYGMVHLMDSAYANLPQIHTPTLLLYGACDEVIPREPMERSLLRYKNPITFAYYPDGYHMLLRDTQGEEVMRDILSWIRSPDTPLPSGAERPDGVGDNSLAPGECPVLKRFKNGSRKKG